MDNLLKIISKIDPIEDEFAIEAQKRLDDLTKPKGSLGVLEELAKRCVAIRKNLSPEIKNKAIYVFAGDHGVTEEGISAYPKAVTSQMVKNFIAGGAGINVLARHAGVEVKVVDIGVDFDFKGEEGIIDKKVSRGTRNMTKGPAMSREEAIKAIHAGIGLAMEYGDDGGALLGVGEMGIGNTTASSAIAAAISGFPIEDLTGRGTGITDDLWERKVRVIKKTLEINKPDPEDPLDVLAKVGGFEIAGIAGFIIGGALKHIPVVIDGFISTAGALIAVKLQPKIKDYLIASHNSVERGHKIILDRMGLKPLFDLSMRLGEGTGAVIGMTLVEMGVKIYREMATFEEAEVEKETGS
ncbi:MAG: nicotinate-nucleotide--dimethylbenzimidazole phosphoribosyltransferase [Deltaproteobacteria bacterium]|nr:nicotinate-nucleotide--dimethylbenzimidazole phosphoribosyltransferase [Deltaproteobacteria bacterium]